MDARVRVEGLKELRQAMRSVEPALKPLVRDELKKAAGPIVGLIQQQVPIGREGQKKRGTKRVKGLGTVVVRRNKRPGSARASVRTTVSGVKVYIEAGGGRAPYYGWLDFGGTLRPVGRRRNTQRRPVIKEGRYIYPTLARHRGELVAAVESAVDQATRKVGLS